MAFKQTRFADDSTSRGGSRTRKAHYRNRVTWLVRRHTAQVPVTIQKRPSGNWIT